MRFFRDEALLRRAIGAALVFGLLGLWARYWREEITSDGTYPTDAYNTANNLTHTLWALAIIALIYVAACLLLPPPSRSAAITKPAAPASSKH